MAYVAVWPWKKLGRLSGWLLITRAASLEEISDEQDSAMSAAGS